MLDADDAALERARAALRAALGAEALVDAAGVVATFSQMDRIADATGIPLDGMLQVATEGLRQEIGIGRFASAANTPPPGVAKRILSRMLAPLLPLLLRLFRLRRRPARRG